MSFSACCQGYEMPENHRVGQSRRSGREPVSLNVNSANHCRIVWEFAELGASSVSSRQGSVHLTTFPRHRTW